MLVCGVGTNDSPTNVSWFEIIDGKRKKTYCPYYQRWKDMLGRCYAEFSLRKWKTYECCTVVDDWLLFSNFKNWMMQQDWKDKQLDKDILYPGNKIYGPDTCVFVGNDVNSFILEKEAGRGEYPLGVSKHSKSGLYRARCCIGKGKSVTIGYFKCPDKAHLAWLEYKRKLAIDLASIQTDSRVSLALATRYDNYK